MARKSVNQPIKEKIIEILKSKKTPINKHYISNLLLIKYKIPKFRAHPNNVYSILTEMRREGTVMAYKNKKEQELLYGVKG